MAKIDESIIEQNNFSLEQPCIKKIFFYFVNLIQFQKSFKDKEKEIDFFLIDIKIDSIYKLINYFIAFCFFKVFDPIY